MTITLSGHSDLANMLGARGWLTRSLQVPAGIRIFLKYI